MSKTKALGSKNIKQLANSLLKPFAKVYTKDL